MKLRRLFSVMMGLVALSLLVGCAGPGMERAPAERKYYLYYPTALVEADRALAAARSAGKDKECPVEFGALKEAVDKAYETYHACRTEEAIKMAQDATAKIKALCPAMPAPKPVPEVKPTPPPPPPAKPAPSSKVMVFEEAAMFDFDKADLKPEGKKQIEAYRQEARAEMSRADKIIITGHTDNVGNSEYNKKLSLRRAEAVRDYLVSIGVDAGKIQVIGKGMDDPIADNSTKESRAKNRRVEVEVVGVGK